MGMLQFGPGPGATQQGSPAPAETGAPSVAPSETAPPIAPSPPAIVENDIGNIDEDQDRQLELRRLQKIEDGLLQKLQRQGSLSLAEEGRLKDVRDQKASL